MTRSRPTRCGFSPKCHLARHHPCSWHGEMWTARWGDEFARERDGSIREFPTEALARAWLAAADATNGASFRHQCT